MEKHIKIQAKEFGISEILLENLGREGYVRVTEVAKHYNKRFDHWLNREATKRFIQIKIDHHNDKAKIIMKKSLTEVLETIETKENRDSIDLYYRENTYYNSVNELGFIPVSSLKRNITIDDLVITLRGDSSVAGTWVHTTLVIRFFEWLDDRFALFIDEYIQELFKKPLPEELENTKNFLSKQIENQGHRSIKELATEVGIKESDVRMRLITEGYLMRLRRTNGNISYKPYAKYNDLFYQKENKFNNDKTLYLTFKGYSKLISLFDTV